MFTHARMFVFATATAVIAPALTNAATVTFENVVNVNENYSYAHVIEPGSSVEFRFTALDELYIKEFSVSATGTNAEADIRDVRFGMVEPLTGLFTTIESIGSVSAGISFIAGMKFDIGSIFSVIFEDGITNDVAVTLSFATESVSPIPLPAAGFLLAPILLLGGVIGARRRKPTSAVA